MKKKTLLCILCALLLVSGCSKGNNGNTEEKPSNSFVNPGDYLGGGGTASEVVETSKDELESSLESAVDSSDLVEISGNTSSNSASSISGTTITEAGNYILSGEINEGIVVTVGNNQTVHLFLNGVNITNSNGIAISNTNKKSNLIITVMKNTINNITSSGDSVNAIHVKGNLIINGSGTLNIISNSKNAIKVSKTFKLVDATLNINSNNHAISAKVIIAKDATINVTSASKDGLNAECDDDTTSYTTEEGYIYLNNVNYTYVGEGDGMQADTYIIVDGGNYNITTNATFVEKTNENKETYDLEDDDFRYIKVNNTYKKVASDERINSTLYAMIQSSKGIKVGEIKYTDDESNEISVTSGDYSLIINSGTFNINSSDDALHVNYGNIIINSGIFEINTLDDGITADKLVDIKGGTIKVLTCYEGIEGAQIQISGDNTNIEVYASDDGINAASDLTDEKLYILIKGGKTYINASGDGLDSNGNIEISGGYLYIDGPTSGGDSAMDSETGILVKGGYIFSVGSLGMVETPASNSTQYVISYAKSTSISANTKLSLKDNDDNEIFSFTTSKTSQSVIISTPELGKDKTYKIYEGSTLVATFTINSTITRVGTSTSSNNPGNPPSNNPGQRPGGFRK